MKPFILPTIVTAILSSGLQAEVIFGGSATRDVQNWTTSSVMFDDTVQSGHSLNWENVITNTVVVDAVENEFEVTWEAGTDHTIGHLYMYNEVLDLATLTNGIQQFYWVANFEAGDFANWSPVISVTTGGVTRYYRWNHSGNDWSGNGPLNFSAPFGGEDPYRFDLSQLGNGTSNATGIWGGLNGTAGDFPSTRDGGTGPNLQAVTGEVRFGFLQWTGSTTLALAETTFATAIDCFDVIINADAGLAPEIVNGPVTGLTATSALVPGELTRFGTDFSNLTLYWGTSDGGTDTQAWDNVEPLGVEACLFDFELTELERGTTYFFRYFAQNSAGSDWADTSGTFTTGFASPPSAIVTPGNPGDPGAAIFTGEVTDTGNESPVVTLFYGLSDEGTNAGAWTSAADLGTQGGAFAEEIGGLDGGATYFYRVFVENSAGAAWSPTTESVTATPLAGLSGILDSGDFDFQYEMNVNPSAQDLDSAGSANDWFAAPAQATGVDRTMLIPQTYTNGIAFSNQSAAVPEALFRTDYGGSIFRESISGSFTVEVALKLEAGTIVNPADLGSFGFFVNPPGQPALRVNINENDVSLGDGSTIASTSSNTDGSHLFRVAYVASDERYFVWRDGILIFGGTDGIPGTDASIFTAGGLFLGDFATDLSGDWEVDFIRLHNDAVGPAGVAGEIVVLDSGFVNGTTFFIDFEGAPNTGYQVTSSIDQQAFDTVEDLFTGANGVTDGNGVGRAEIDVTGRTGGKLFFRVEPAD